MEVKVIHLMQDGKFADGIVQFYDEFYSDEQHEIIYFTRNNENIHIRKNCKIAQKVFNLQDCKKSVISYLNTLDCDYIFLHSLFFTSCEKVELFLNKKLLKKIVWIEWGADLYSWRQPESIKGKVKNYINYKLRDSFQNVVCIFPPDIDYFKHEFPKFRGHIYYAPYNGYPVDKEFLKYKKTSKLNEVLKNKEPIYIQIGQNSLETLNHVKVIKYLSKFRDEDIRIFLPLSYGGTEEYVNRVVKCAEENFPNKSIILRDFMPKKEYFQLTEKISIAIFDTTRQCGLGNIERFNFRNVKVYLSEEGVMYQYFRNQGVPVEKCENIGRMDFNEFVSQPVITDYNKFMDYINTLSNIGFAVEKWNRIFEVLRREMNEK